MVGLALTNYLIDKGYDVSIRTLQRDMNALESVFSGIDSCKSSDRSICWFLTGDVPVNISKLSLKQHCNDANHAGFNRSNSTNENIYYEAA